MFRLFRLSAAPASTAARPSTNTTAQTTRKPHHLNSRRVSSAAPHLEQPNSVLVDETQAATIKREEVGILAPWVAQQPPHPVFRSENGQDNLDEYTCPRPSPSWG